MVSSKRILVLTNELAVADRVSSVLQHGEVEIAAVCSDLPELASQLERNPLGAVLVDIDPQPHYMLSRLEGVISQFDQTRFVVMSQDLQQDLMLDAMNAGARHFLVKQSIQTELADVLQRLLANGSSNGRHGGGLITVLSGSGGCGATTISVNLASELQESSSGQSLIVDLDTSYGSIATYLGVDGNYGLADVLMYDGPIDANLISSTVWHYNENLHVLASPASVDFSQPQPVMYDHLERALATCRQSYDWTVVDAARVPIDVAANLAMTSTMTFIVGQMSVKDIRTIRSMRQALMQRHVPGDSLRVVINRYSRRSRTVPMKDAQKALGDVPMELIGNDFRSAIGGINFGKPLSEFAARTSLRRDIRELAEMVVQSTAQTDGVKAA